MSGGPVSSETASIGQRLSRAREARKLGIEKVADALHLDVRTVKALERDDHAALPSPIFVKGYLRGYAALVGLPAEELVPHPVDLGEGAFSQKAVYLIDVMDDFTFIKQHRTLPCGYLPVRYRCPVFSLLQASLAV